MTKENSITLLKGMSSLQLEVYRYLWAVGTTAAKKLPGSRVENDRYFVVAPQIWLDTQPGSEPYVPAMLPDAALPYLQLYPQGLHVPQVYGVCQDEQTASEILLLENAPLEASGELQPAIVQAWQQASAVRQINWLWQILQLWRPLLKLGVASSLLSPDNLRVEGWRVRLRELIQDEDDQTHTTASFVQPCLANLAQCWLVWVPEAKTSIAESLKALCEKMQQAESTFEEIAAQLNQLLLEQSARLPLRLQVFGATEVGPQRSHNEDTCYPLTIQNQTLPHDELTPRLTIVCDGIGGHEGGEVASQLAVQSLQLQIRALLTEISQQTEPTPPDLLAEQLSAIVRVVNNMISAQNDAQDREARRRMGTTLVMALQVPQRVKLPGGAVASNAHELYITNVGDSRAYWITPRYCHQLTVDDDVITREISQGRALHRDVLKRPDAGALTQALGTRDSQFLHPVVQRFILEEDGLLLLCSDGLSDHDLVEKSWATYADLILKERVSLESAVQSWLELANEQNGHDNSSIVLTYCHVSSPLPEVRVPIETRGDDRSTQLPLAGIDADSNVETTAPQRRRSKRALSIKILLMLLLSSLVGMGIWYSVDPVGFQQVRDRLQLGNWR